MASSLELCRPHPCSRPQQISRVCMPFCAVRLAKRSGYRIAVIELCQMGRVYSPNPRHQIRIMHSFMHSGKKRSVTFSKDDLLVRLSKSHVG